MSPDYSKYPIVFYRQKSIILFFIIMGCLALFLILDILFGLGFYKPISNLPTLLHYLLAGLMGAVLVVSYRTLFKQRPIISLYDNYLIVHHAIHQNQDEIFYYHTLQKPNFGFGLLPIMTLRHKHSEIGFNLYAKQLPIFALQSNGTPITPQQFSQIVNQFYH